ncbi:MAG: nucleotidyltransferase domain-containing protein [Deltaproteobacteria bacterium]|nr:nucleotidyltransferase domain-containing protein [Deltaproteobacteria bacterium]
MIRDGIKLDNNVLERLPGLIQAIKQHSEVIALYSFGSAVNNELKPLSDLDFAILLSGQLNRQQRFKKHLELIGIFNTVFSTDEIDLTILNDAAFRFSFVVLKTGRLLYYRNKAELVDFRDQVVKNYLDFKYFRDSFDHTFLKGIGYNG